MVQRLGARPGDKVKLAPEGLPVIEGVADYLGSEPNYLGVRTDDALYRFHGRAGIGMSIAVGHHLFRPDIDVEQTRAAWRSWLSSHVLQLASQNEASVL